MNLVALPAFADNIVWMLHDDAQALVVDPGMAQPVTAAIDAAGLALTAILVTHHHPDHVGGVAQLLAAEPARRKRLGLTAAAPGTATIEISIPAGEASRMPFEGGMARQGGDRFDWRGQAIEVIDVPGHTAGHIAYAIRPTSGPARLMVGDTLFSAGCGRLFEGSPAQMQQSLARLAAWPDDTLVHCAHEYTLSNLKFAAAVEPGSAAVIRHREHCEALRAEGRFTLPSTIGTERAINPFLRLDVAQVQDAARAHGAPDSSPVEVFAALRRWKDRF